MAMHLFYDSPMNGATPIILVSFYRLLVRIVNNFSREAPSFQGYLILFF